MHVFADRECARALKADELNREDMLLVRHGGTTGWCRGHKGWPGGRYSLAFGLSCWHKTLHP